MSRCSISLDPSGQLLLEIPSQTVSGGHSILIPPTEGGLKILTQTLRKREAAISRLGDVGSPTQAQVEAWLRQDRAERQEKAKQKTLGDFPGLDMEIDL